MDQWNLFKSNSTSDNNSMMDFTSNFGTTNTRFSSMNGQNSTSRMSMNSGNNMNPFGSNHSLGNSSTMNMPSSFTGSSHNMHPFSSSNGSYNNSGVMSTNSAFNINSQNTASSYGLNSMAPPMNVPQSMPSANGYNNQAPQNRYGNVGTNYYRQQSAPAQPTMGPRTPTNSFPPPPTPQSNPVGQNSYYNSNGTSSGTYGSSNGSSNMFQSSMNSARPMSSGGSSSNNHSMSMHQNNSGASNYYSDTSNSGSASSSGFPPIGDFKIDTFSMNSSGQVNEGSSSNMDSSNRGYGSSTNNGATNGQTVDNGENLRETGIIEKLLQTYGFIQCCERQARLFFHFSQFDGNTDHLRIGDPVEFEVTFDRRTGKPIASSVQKISPEVVLSEERVVGAVTTELMNENGVETRGRISYENRGECFFLPYGKDDVEGYVILKPGDKVSFQIATNQRTGNLGSRHVRLENPVAPVRYQGVVSTINEGYGLIERADVVDEICFHLEETKHIDGGLKLGDDVDFCITSQNSKEVAIEIVKLQDGSVVFEDTSTDLVRGQVIKGVERSPRHNPKEPLPGRIKYRGSDYSEVEVKFGERDLKGEFTLKHGDWVQFNIATDRRDKLQKATNITLLDQSFAALGERREVGLVHLLKEGSGYIVCSERDLLMHFFYKELINPNVPISIGDELEFSVSQQENELSGVCKLTAIRIAHAPQDRNFATFQEVLQDDLQGQIISVAKGTADMVAPDKPSSMSLAKEAKGTIAYMVEGIKQTVEYMFDEKYKDVELNEVVNFQIMRSQRKRKMYGVIKSIIALNLPNNELNSIKPSEPVVHNLLNDEPVKANDHPILIPEKLHTGATNDSSENDLSFSGIAVSSAVVAAPAPAPTSAKKTRKSKAIKQHNLQGYIAALKESFGFVETINHDKEIFFHFSNVEGVESSTLELGDEVEYTLSTLPGPGGKVSAENIKLLAVGTLPKPIIRDPVFYGVVIRPIRSSNPTQSEYCGLLATDTDILEMSEQYRFGITGVLNKRELLQKNDLVTHQVDLEGWAVNITANRTKRIATVDTVKGQYGFLNYELEEDGKKLFFHQTEVKDKTTLAAGDEVDFVVITNQKTGKSSACNITLIMPVTGQAKRPQRLISQLKTMSLRDQTKPRIIVLRQPKGPDFGSGFSFDRVDEPSLVVVQ